MNGTEPSNIGDTKINDAWPIEHSGKIPTFYRAIVAGIERGASITPPRAALTFLPLVERGRGAERER